MSQVAVAQCKPTITLSISGCANTLADKLAVKAAEAEANYYIEQMGIGFNSLQECNAFRNAIISISFGSGSCRVRYNVSQCMDCQNRAMGEANILAIGQGNTFYSTNGANEIRDWSNDYIERMLALNPDYPYFDPANVPTDDPEFNSAIAEISINMPGGFDLINKEDLNSTDGSTGTRNGIVLSNENLKGNIRTLQTESIPIAQTAILELTEMTHPELNEHISIAEKYITTEYNQRVLELNKQIIIWQFIEKYVFANGVTTQRVIGETRRNMESEIEKIKDELISKYGVSEEEIKNIIKESERMWSTTAKLLDDTTPQNGVDLNQATIGVAYLYEASWNELISKEIKSLEAERNDLDYNYNNDVNKLKNLKDLLNIQPGIDKDGKITYGAISPERTYDVMTWYGNNGKDIYTLFPEKCIGIFMKKSTTIIFK